MLGLPAVAGCGPLARLTGPPSARLDLTSVGPLQPGRGRILERVLDLPAGFSQRLLAASGNPMGDGRYVPALPMGLGTFSLSDKEVVVLCSYGVRPGSPSRTGPFGYQNHLFNDSDAPRVYDAGPAAAKPAYAAVTSLTYDVQTGRTRQHGLRLGGLLGASLGSETPWGSWLCGEAVVQPASDRYAQPHGFVFEIPAAPRADATGPVAPVRALGRFSHAAISVDPETGVIYQTEARPDGLLYRFIPDEPGRLTAGGRLEALALDVERDTRDLHTSLTPGAAFPLRWVDLSDIDHTGEEDDLRARGAERGATAFADGAGMAFDGQALYVTCRSGGPNRQGQLWRYHPDRSAKRPGEEQAGRLELVLQPEAGSRLAGLDDVAVSPWGDLLFPGVDAEGRTYLLGMTTEGALYELARNAFSKARFTGMTFSPDGSTLFVNLPDSGMTLTLEGPWLSI